MLKYHPDHHENWHVTNGNWAGRTRFGGERCQCLGQCQRQCPSYQITTASACGLRIAKLHATTWRLTHPSHLHSPPVSSKVATAVYHSVSPPLPNHHGHPTAVGAAMRDGCVPRAAECADSTASQHCRSATHRVAPSPTPYRACRVTMPTADEITTSGQLREVTRFFEESLQIWST